MNRVKSINILFLLTIFTAILGSFINAYVSYFISDNQVVLLLISQFILIAPTILYIILFRINILDLIRFKKIKIVNVILLIIIAYTLTPIMSFINLVSMYFATNVIQGTITGIVEQNSFLVGLIGIAFIPSIFEEVVYRGVFYNEYRKVNTLKGIFLSGLLFGLMHMNINQFLYAFAMGVIFALLIEATDSILASMIVHFVINGTSFFFSYIQPKLEEMLSSDTAVAIVGDSSQELTSADITASLMPMFIMALVGGVLSFLLFRAIAKNSGRTEQVKAIFSGKKQNIAVDPELNDFNTQYYSETDGYNQDQTMQMQSGSKQKLITLPLIIGIGIAVVLMLMNEFV